MRKRRLEDGGRDRGRAMPEQLKKRDIDITRQVLHGVPGRSHSHNGMCTGELPAGL